MPLPILPILIGSAAALIYRGFKAQEPPTEGENTSPKAAKKPAKKAPPKAAKKPSPKAESKPKRGPGRPPKKQTVEKPPEPEKQVDDEEKQSDNQD